jgi:hypothetical protein
MSVAVTWSDTILQPPKDKDVRLVADVPDVLTPLIKPSP